MKENRKRIKLSISLETKKQLRVLAALADTTMSDKITDLVTQEYERLRLPPVPPAPVKIDPDDLP